MLFDSDNFSDELRKKHLLKHSIICALSYDGSIMLLNYQKNTEIDYALIKSFRKVWFLGKQDKRSRIRCIWEAKKLGALPDMIYGLMVEWSVSENDLKIFGSETQYFNCDRCEHSQVLDSFGAYSCTARGIRPDLWVQVRPRGKNMSLFPKLFYSEEIVGVCSFFTPSI